MPSDHTVKAYDVELDNLRAMLMEMGNIAIDQLSLVLRSMSDGSVELPTRVIEREPLIDSLEHQVDQLVFRILALRQPAAVDLREVLTGLRLANELERICDHAKNIAQRIITLRGHPAQGLPFPAAIAQFAATMLEDVVQASKARDAEKAREIWARDARLDEMYSSFVRELLTHIMEDPRQISPAIHVLFIARDLERVGDRATNMAEMVEFLVSGEIVEAARQKADTTKSVMLPAATAPECPPRPSFTR